MKMTSISLLAIIAMGMCALQLVAGETPVKKAFTAKLVVSQNINGNSAVVASPSLTLLDSQEGSCQIGNEVLIDADSHETVFYGFQVRITIHELADGRRRVTLYVAQSDLEQNEESNIQIRETGLHCVKTIKPGEKIELIISPNLKATLTVDPAVINPSKP